MYTFYGCKDETHEAVDTRYFKVIIDYIFYQ